MSKAVARYKAGILLKWGRKESVDYQGKGGGKRECML